MSQTLENAVKILTGMYTLIVKVSYLLPFMIIYISARVLMMSASPVFLIVVKVKQKAYLMYWNSRYTHVTSICMALADWCYKGASVLIDM